MMKRTSLMIGTALLIFSLSSVAFANKNGGHKQGPNFNNYIEQLGLDENTLAKIKEIRRADRDNKVEIKYKVEKAKNRLKDLLQEDNPRESAVMDAADDVGELETEMRKSRLRTMLKINSLLSPDQRATFRKMQRERKQKKNQRKMKRRHKGDF